MSNASQAFRSFLYTCTVNNDGRAGNEDIFPEPAIKVSQSGVLSGISS